MQDKQSVAAIMDDELGELRILIDRYKGLRDAEDIDGMNELRPELIRQMQGCHTVIGGYLSDGLFSGNEGRDWMARLRALGAEVAELAPHKGTPARTTALTFI